MTLAEWQQVKDVNDRQLAERITDRLNEMTGKRRARALSAQVVQKYRGGTVPRRDIMMAIYHITDGWVQPNDFYGIDSVPFAS
jgi:hypothetical protein